MMAMYEVNKTTDNIYPWEKSPYYPTWNPPPINWSWDWPKCLICKGKYLSIDNLIEIKTPDGQLVGYLCTSCNSKYSIEIKKKD